MQSELCVLIPAVKKKAAFTDDLIKKLAGVTLIERAIQKGVEIAQEANVFVITDSQEISLICSRAGVQYSCKPDLQLTSEDVLSSLKSFILKIYKYYRSGLILYPYSPLLKTDTIIKTFEKFKKTGCDLMYSVKKESRRRFHKNGSSFQDVVFREISKNYLSEFKGFLFFKSSLIKSGYEKCSVKYCLINENIPEIRNYQDWWICEKLLLRKRIVFRVIGNKKVGMGHIYRALAIAHEITAHEIIFACDTKSELAVLLVSDINYLIHTASKREIEKKIIELNPDLVVNDILNTTKTYVRAFKKNGIKVVNFEDLGTGAEEADITFNELYDEPLLHGGNIFWGNRYFFLREEFVKATVRRYSRYVESLLITFGGTDQHNLTMKVLNIVGEYCIEKKIFIRIVTGPSYLHKKSLESLIQEWPAKNLEFTSATDVISSIMEKSDIAISSNGRTVYELAHMNIPALIVSQHEREETHRFSVKKNGFISLPGFFEANFGESLLKEFRLLVEGGQYRKELFENMKAHDFSRNKAKVVSLIEGLLSSEKTVA